MLVVWSEAELDQCAGIWNRFALPSIGGLIAAQSLLRRIVEGSRRISAEVMLTNQCLLNFLGAAGIDLLLTSRLLRDRLPRFMSLGRWSS